MNHTIRFLILLPICLITGCVTHLSVEECRFINWYEKGFAEGSNGKSPNNLMREQQDCARYNIPINRQQYTQGWQVGIEQYCTPDNGFALGASGQALIDYCPIHRSRAFVNAWQHGVRTYCKPEVAFDLGKRGERQPDCPIDLKATFNAEYQRGYGIYQHTETLNHRIATIDNEMADLQKKVDHIRWERKKHHQKDSHIELIWLEHRLQELQRQREFQQDEIARFNTMR